MELFYPTEKDFRKWIKDAIFEYFEGKKTNDKRPGNFDEPLLTRKRISDCIKNVPS